MSESRGIDDGNGFWEKFIKEHSRKFIFFINFSSKNSHQKFDENYLIKAREEGLLFYLVHVEDDIILKKYNQNDELEEIEAEKLNISEKLNEILQKKPYFLKSQVAKYHTIIALSLTIIVVVSLIFTYPSSSSIYSPVKSPNSVDHSPVVSSIKYSFEFIMKEMKKIYNTFQK
eukprot:TRINITY_DN2098_c1_g1_i2.p1 TRINITY_DN2098_c1_g1~~TRINITY_DN2098_c1_g1_i2.p1  ORF type:complete len:173 (-),score=48.07 TRINITY_DN2098_c1_g1_i2:42-560(-)